MEKLNAQELLEEIKLALHDTFVAELTNENESLVLRFLSGQKFRLSLEEL